MWMLFERNELSIKKFIGVLWDFSVFKILSMVLSLFRMYIKDTELFWGLPFIIYLL